MIEWKIILITVSLLSGNYQSEAKILGRFVDMDGCEVRAEQVYQEIIGIKRFHSVYAFCAMLPNKNTV